MSDIVSNLSPTQEHFLKKYLLEQCLADELHELSEPDCCQKIGFPFSNNSDIDYLAQLPMVRFIFQRFIITFPFLSHNSEANQIRFWQSTVQPFVESFNLKPISTSEERRANVTKRRQVNHKFMSSFLFFYNSTIISPKDLDYFNSDHLKASDSGKIDKLATATNVVDSQLSTTHYLQSLDDFKKMNFHNGLALNVVAVRTNEVSRNKLLFLSFLPSSDPLVRKHEYVINVVRRIDKEEGIYSKHFVSRGYKDFQSLHSKLVRKYPGIGLPLLPLKPKNDLNSILVKEKLRLALRGYLLTVFKFSEVAHLSYFIDFISLEKFDSLLELDQKDYNKRVIQEAKMIETQRQFQQITSIAIKEMSNSLELLKAELIKNPHSLTKIIQEIGTISNIKEMSPLLQTFNEWSKLEVAALFYQSFIALDNSSDWFLKIKRFHRLFPYTLVYGILRVTNPAKIVSKIIDLLLVNMPSLPSWGSLTSGSKSNESRNLLSYIFVSIMDEDLSGNHKELEEIKARIPPDLNTFIQRIEAYSSLSYEEVNHLKDYALENDHDLCLEVLLTNLLTPKLSMTDIELFKIIQSLYECYKNGDMKKGEIYSLLCQYWQLRVKQRDSELFKQLWKEPELTHLIKDFLTTFYHPLMDLFCKCNIHLVFRDFQLFMNDFIELFTELSDSGQYYKTPMEMYNDIKGLLDTHESMFWNFANNIYSKDDKHLFSNITQWLELILVNLRLKQLRPELVTIHFKVDDAKIIDKELFLKQLNGRVSRSLEKRKLVEQFLGNCMALNEKPKENKTFQELIDNQWDELHDQMISGFGGAEDFGLLSDDINELNLKQDGTGESEKELRSRLKQLDEEASKFGTSELDKFIEGFKLQLIELLPRLHTELETVRKKLGETYIDS